jgi:hypothetical protein
MTGFKLEASCLQRLTFSHSFSAVCRCTMEQLRSAIDLLHEIKAINSIVAAHRMKGWIICYKIACQKLRDTSRNFFKNSTLLVHSALAP